MYRVTPTAICLLMLLSPHRVEASKLHIVIAADTKDKTTGKYSQYNARNLTSTIDGDMPNGSCAVHWVGSEQMTAGGVTSYIRNLRVDSDDALLFYYSGHGAYSNQTGHYLSFSSGQNVLTRKRVSELLESKNTRFVALITESCFNYNEPEKPNNAPKAAAAAAPMAPKPVPPLFLKLFFNVRGFVDLNACQTDEKAWTYASEFRGSIFTSVLCRQLNQHQQKSDINWNDMRRLVADETGREFRQAYPRGQTARDSSGNRLVQRTQTPVFVTPARLRAASSQPTIVDNFPRGPRVPLGITVRTCDEGAHVETVSAGSPATRCTDSNTGEELRLESGDHILTVNGVQTPTNDRVIAAVNATTGRLEMRVKDRRNGRIRTLVTFLVNEQVVLRPPFRPAPPAVPRGRRVSLGITVRTCPDGGHIETVGSGTPATRCVDEASGRRVVLQAGDHIIAVNGVSRRTQEQVVSAVNGTNFELFLKIVDRSGKIRNLKTYLR